MYKRQEEDEQLEIFVKLSGLTKQDYIIRRLLEKEVVVQGNPRVYKALRDELAAVLDELRRIESGQGMNDELLGTIPVSYTHLDVYKRQVHFYTFATPGANVPSLVFYYIAGFLLSLIHI